MKISVVIPAYNESKRLPSFLEALIVALSQEFNDEFEIIIVDDGSGDDTTNIALNILKKHGRVVTLPSNMGKGAAVRAGVKLAHGEFVCITDADGSADLESFKHTYHLMKESNSFGIIGSRYGYRQNLESKLTLKRRFFGKLFAWSTKLILGLSYSDTQCGFKIFKGPTIKTILGHCQMNRFGLDFELLYVSSLYGIQFKEYAIKWTEKPGSKVSLLKDGIRMILEMFQVRLIHSKGIDLGETIEMKPQSLYQSGQTLPAEPPDSTQAKTLPKHYEKKQRRI